MDDVTPKAASRKTRAERGFHLSHSDCIIPAKTHNRSSAFVTFALLV
jgi:hypothetical protein